MKTIEITGGRSPAGRDHARSDVLWSGWDWKPQAARSFGRGEQVVGNPIGMQRVLATVYHVLGIDPAVTIPDYNGRPQFLLDDRAPLGALL